MSATEDILAVVALGRQKLVEARVVRLVEPPRAIAEELDALLSRHRYHEADHGQGREKRQALYWLRRRGAQELHAERDFGAGRYDVAAEDLGVLVECGTTRIDKLLKTSLYPEWREFVIIPRGLNIAVVFDFTGSVFSQVRCLAEQAQDPIMFLERVCHEERLTIQSLAQCLTEANIAHETKFNDLRNIMDSIRGCTSSESSSPTSLTN